MIRNFAGEFAIDANVKIIRTMQEADNLKERILETATTKMTVAGVRSVSIDDICRELGISKKTFYVYFES